MATENQSQAPSLNEIEGEITDAELGAVSGGDKATTTKPPTKPTTKPTTPYLEVTIQEVTISS
jgi:hypothetical protein